MKTLFKSILLLLLITVVTYSQTFDEPKYHRSDAELVIDFGMASTALDSAAQDISAAFTLEDYDATDGDVFTLYTNLTSAGTPKTDISIYGCETAGGTYVLLDAVQDAEADKGAVYTPFDLADKRAEFYKVYVTNEATGAALTGYHIKIRCSSKDNAVKN